MPIPADNIPAQAKAIINQEMQKMSYFPKRIFLFGSRARKNFRPDSDWDFYVIVEKDIPENIRREMIKNIRRRFAGQGFWGDVIIHPQHVVETRKKNTGFLTYYVLKEGKEI